VGLLVMRSVIQIKNDKLEVKNQKIMKNLDKFKLPRALSWGISIVGIAVIVMFIVAVTAAQQDKRADEIEKCFTLIESSQGVIDVLQQLNANYEAEENKINPDVNKLNEMNQQRLEGAEILSVQKKFMDKYNCW
jgi:predicted PurR-regulated permease PerM